jgi:HPt (histidine-containing phosphotransfer) domain-containing protein
MDAEPIVDRERLSIVSRGNAERAREFFGMLVEDAQVASERLRELLVSGDLQAVHEIAHSLKGMALEVGTPRLASAAAVLEAERDPALLVALVEEVARATAELRGALATL